MHIDLFLRTTARRTSAASVCALLLGALGAEAGATPVAVLSVPAPGPIEPGLIEPGPIAAQGDPTGAEAKVVATGPITTALRSVDEDVRVYNEHLTVLASTWMAGRLPGTRGMELAMEYMEFYFDRMGLERPYVTNEGPSYRQPFSLGETTVVSRADFELKDGDRTLGLRFGENGDFTLTDLGRGSEIDAELVFVGYGIEGGPDGYDSYGDVDLAGKVAVMLRYEPLNEEGWSRWEEEGWSRHAGFLGKLRAARAHGAGAAIIINTPGAADPRSKKLATQVTARPIADFPVLNMTAEAGRQLVEFTTGGRSTLDQLVANANGEAAPVNLSAHLRMKAEIETKVAIAENLVGVLKGKGALADEVIVIGAHLDHLGQGEFGSRDRLAGRALHPGADDNASGAAGILHIASKMVKDYESAPADANLRTIHFIAFSAEESGLNGSNYYVENPLVPIEQHALMMNFDMIGRMADSRLSLSGVGSAVGLPELVAPFVERSPLNVVLNEGMSGGSDHRPFYSKQVPILFAIIKDLHPDYHTSRDVGYLINRVEAVHAANLFYDIGLAYAMEAERFPFKGPERRVRRRGQGRDQVPGEVAEAPEPEAPRATVNVRLGVKPDYDDGVEGVLISGTTEGSPAAKAGLLAGDRIVSWDGKPLPGAAEMMGFLRTAEPGQTVKLGVVRAEKEIAVEVKLEAREGDGR